MDNTAYRNAYRAGFAVFAVLLIHAAVFYKERMVMPDAAFYLFSIIQRHGFAVMHNRFVCAVPEILPLIGLKLGAPLSALAMLYSLAFPLYYLGCYLLCGRVFRNYRMAVVLLLYLILISTHTQYWMLSELSLGAALLKVLLAGVTGDVKRQGARLWAFLAFALLLIITIGFAHPLLVFAVLFSTIFLIIESPDSRRAMFLCAAAYAAVLLVKSLTYQEAYEANALTGLDRFQHLSRDFFTLYANKRFLPNHAGKWWSIPVCSAAILIVYLCSRQWARLLLFCSFMTGYVLLVNVCYPDAYTLELYVENFYLLLGLFMALPLVYNVAPILSARRIAAPAFGLLAILCLLRIWSAHRFYTARVSWERGLISRSEGRKLILSANILPNDTMLYSWCIPYETWLLSSIEKGEAASIAVQEAPGLLPGETSGDPRLFVCTWEAHAYSSLPPRYFPFKDTVHVYEHIWSKPW